MQDTASQNDKTQPQDPKEAFKRALLAREIVKASQILLKESKYLLDQTISPEGTFIHHLISHIKNLYDQFYHRILINYIKITSDALANNQQTSPI